MKIRRLAPVLLVPLTLVSCRPEVASDGEPPVAETVAETMAETVTEAQWTDLLPNARRPFEGIVSGGQPEPEQLATARDLGFKTVVNLRAAGEPGSRREEVEALGLVYLEIPIAGAEGLTAENALAFAAALEEAERPALVHCGSGNRAGALFALKAFHADGKSAEEALAIGKAAGLTRLEGAVERHLRAAAEEE